MRNVFTFSALSVSLVLTCAVLMAPGPLNAAKPAKAADLKPAAASSINPPSATVILNRIKAVAPQIVDKSLAESVQRAVLVAKSSAPAPAAAAAPTNIACYTTDAYATIVKNVDVAFPGDQSYWLNYRPLGSVQWVQFIVVPVDTGILTSITQKFEFPNGFEGGISTPFGIPFWPNGNLTTGNWVLVVKTDTGQSAAWAFNVVALQ